ncbi:MAG TPA: putative LPS assembly protein LptD, partial [Thermoanaerobaculaceae bacterium]|nr:putative LPS assembly protein LptD [Thermoanaerobaculaceae bacterium]
MERTALPIAAGTTAWPRHAAVGAWLVAGLALAASGMAATEPTPTPPAPTTASEPAPPPGIPPPAAPASPAMTDTPQTQSTPAGMISLQATHQQMVEDQFVCAEGNVRVMFQDIHLQCDSIELDQKTMKVKTSGNVVLDQGGTRMACDRLEFDLNRKTGTLYKVDAFLPPTYYFRGASLEKLDETHYRLRNGLFTSCALTDDSPPWSIQISDATVELEGYGHFRGVSLKVQGVPVFYTPRLLWPVKRDRAAGLLVPNIGYNNRRGAYLGNAFFWPITRSIDTTGFLDLYSKGWVGIGDEVRWAPTESARGQLQLYTLRDPDGRWEWKALGRHNQLFAGGYALKAE